jgi:hypothetical protein
MKQNTFSSLPASHQRLVRLMQQIGFGHIDDLHVRDGLPVFDPPPRVVEDVKFATENGPRNELANSDFALKQQVLDLILHFQRIGNGVVHTLIFKHGLPFSMSIEAGVLAACAFTE